MENLILPGNIETVGVLTGAAVRVLIEGLLFLRRNKIWVAQAEQDAPYIHELNFFQQHRLAREAVLGDSFLYSSWRDRSSLLSLPGDLALVTNDQPGFAGAWKKGFGGVGLLFDTVHLLSMAKRNWDYRSVFSFSDEVTIEVGSDDE